MDVEQTEDFSQKSSTLLLCPLRSSQEVTQNRTEPNLGFAMRRQRLVLRFARPLLGTHGKEKSMIDFQDVLICWVFLTSAFFRRRFG
jgi:hypothetical protein